MPKRVLLLAILPAITFPCASRADTFAVHSQSSYLQSDAAQNPVIIDLSALTFPVNDGDIIRIQRLGFFKQTGAAPDNSTTMGGVFSSSNTFLSNANLHRVPGAIDAGTDNNSGANNITEDFGIDLFAIGTAPTVTTLDIQVPVGAHYLFVSVLDTTYTDNSDPNSDYAVSVTQVPEPASLLTLGLGCAGLALRRRQRKA